MVFFLFFLFYMRLASRKKKKGFYFFFFFFWKKSSWKERETETERETLASVLFPPIPTDPLGSPNHLNIFEHLQEDHGVRHCNINFYLIFKNHDLGPSCSPILRIPQAHCRLGLGKAGRRFTRKPVQPPFWFSDPNTVQTF